MKKFVSAGLVLGILLLVLIVVFILIERTRGQHALNSRLRQLTDQGEKLDYRELLPPKPAEEQNAAIDLSTLTNELQSFSKLSMSAPPSFHFTAPGRVMAGWQLDAWEDYDVAKGTLGKSSSNSWEKFGPQIEAAGPALERLKSIWPKTGYDDGFDYNKGFVDFHPRTLLIFCKQTSVLLSEAISNDLRKGDVDAAQKHLRSLLAVTRGLGNERLVISQLVDEACANIAWSATWSALQRPGWTEAQLRELQTAWENVNDFPLAMVESCEMERAMTLDYFNQIRSSRSLALSKLTFEDSLPSFLSSNSEDSPKPNLALRQIHVSVWQLAWAAQDELRAVDMWETIVKGGRIAATNSWNDAHSLFASEELIPSPLGLGVKISEEEPYWYDRWRFLFSAEPISVNGSTILRPSEIETEKNLAITAIALKRYELSRGRPATELKDLVPEFLTSVPIDRMDGKPLRYHLNSDGSFKLYSVGLNGIDDGGDPVPEKTQEKFSNIWQGKDAVWPIPAKN